MSKRPQLTLRAIGSAEAWHQAIIDLPNLHPLQSWAWGELKSRWGWQMQPVVWEESGQPVAAAMLLKRRIPRTPFSILYAPKGPIFDYENGALRREVLRELATFAKAQRALFVKIDPDVTLARGIEPRKSALGLAFQAELAENGWMVSAEQIQFRNTVTLDITRSEDDILKAMKSKTRYNTRLAVRKDVVVRAADESDFDLIAQLYTETAQRDGFLIRPKAYYLDVWRTFQQAGMLQAFIAEYEGTPLAAVIIIRYGKLAIYMYGASTQQHRSRMPAYLLQWEAIKWAKAMGCTTYDFWGAPDYFDESDRMWGVWRFKRGYNGSVEHQLGAWDYPAYPKLYQLYTHLLPKYRDILRNKAKS